MILIVVIHQHSIYPSLALSIPITNPTTIQVDRMLDTRVSGVDFWAINTDAQALGRSKAKGARVLNIGVSH